MNLAAVEEAVFRIMDRLNASVVRSIGSIQFTEVAEVITESTWGSTENATQAAVGR